MAIDFSALDEPAPAEASGRPLMLNVADIDEDEDQPRTEFDLTEMRASIRARLAAGKPPIKQPISVKPNPNKPGRWLLNDGARRTRSCRAEEVEEIPGWVDADHDDYDQVLVNNQHDKLRPMELALFIKKKLEKGDSKGEIANRLGYDKAVITHHLALVDAPDCVVNAYRSGKTKSARTLYELRNAYERWPEQVDEWVASSSEVTRPQIAALLRRLEAPPAPSVQDDNILDVPLAEVAGGDQQAGSARTLTHQGGTEGISVEPPANKHGSAPGGTAAGGGNSGEPNTHAAPKFGHDQKNSAEAQPKARDTSGPGAGQASVTAGDQKGMPPHSVNAGHSTDGSAPRAPAVSDSERMAKPLLLVEFDGRAASVLLNRRPTTPGLIHIRFEDGSGEQEVDAGLCKINQLTEA